MNEYVFENVRIFDGTGRGLYPGAVRVRDNKIETVSEKTTLDHGALAQVIDGKGATLMPGLIEPHGHLSFPNGRSNEFTFIPNEELMLETVRNAKIALDCGYTSVFSAAAMRPRLDIVLKREIEAGRCPGPRYLACSPEITVTGGLGDTNQVHLPYNQSTTFCHIVDGPEEIRRAVRTFAREGVDPIKLHLSGDLGASSAPSEQTPMSDAEVSAAMEVAASRELRVVCHARSATSVLAALRYGIDIINHANYAHGPALDGLEAAKDRVVVIPAISITHAIAYSNGQWGVPPGRARAFQEELEATLVSVEQMRKRGIRVLPGGDYGFIYTPHGDYARDLWLFTEVLGFTAMETLVAATRYGADVMGMRGQIGVIKEGALADILLVDGDPLEDIAILQKRDALLMIMKDGDMHKPPARERWKSGAGHVRSH
jgi:imidazolonepropionase-like amidohydrolase